MSLENEERNSAYEKLTPQRKQLVDKVMENLEKGNLFWSQGWVSSGAPESAVTGKKYRGINNLFLSLIAMSENYEDNRWATFKQMEEKGWTFKKDEEGKSAAKGKGATVEYYEMRDKETKKRFDRLYLRRQRDPHQKDYFVCSVYRKKRKYFCTSHFIRLADIEKILLRDLRQVTAFAREHESEFLDLAKKRSLRETEKLRAENKASLDKAVRRIAEIDGIIQKLYEDNVSGKISDERFAKMTATYETEQNGLQQTAQRLKDEISAVREEGESVDRFMKLVNKYSDITELNAEIIRTFVEKIIVYEAEKNDGVKTQKVKIVYNCVGTVSVPDTNNEPVKTDKTKIIEVA